MSLKSRHDLREAFQKMTGGIDGYTLILLDIDGTILTWNDGAEHLKGYTTQEIIGQHVSMFYLPQDRDTLPQKLLAEAAVKGKVVNTGRHIRKNGTIFWGSIEIVAVKDDDGKLLGFTNFARELKDELDIGHFWFDTDGVLHTRAGSVPQTPDRIEQLRGMLQASLHNGKICCITDIRQMQITDAGMSYMTPDIAKIYKAVAFVSDPQVDDNTKIVMSVMPNEVPSKVFTSRDSAKIWIRQFA